MNSLISSLTKPVTYARSYLRHNAIRKERAHYAVNSIKQLVSEELAKQESSLISKINPEIYKNIYKISRKKSKKPIFIGISGGSASGKTLMTDLFVKNANTALAQNPYKPFAEKIVIDDFTYDMSKTVRKMGNPEMFFESYNFDQPNAIEFNLLKKKIRQLQKGNNVLAPKLLFNRYAERADNVSPVLSAPIMVMEGLFPFHKRGLRKKQVLKFFVDTPEHLRKQRWWERARKRDINQDARGLTLFNKVFASYKHYVEPSKQYADVIFNGAASPEAIDHFTQKLVTLMKQVQNYKVS